MEWKAIISVRIGSIPCSSMSTRLHAWIATENAYCFHRNGEERSIRCGPKTNANIRLPAHDNTSKVSLKSVSFCSVSIPEALPDYTTSRQGRCDTKVDCAEEKRENVFKQQKSLQVRAPTFWVSIAVVKVNYWYVLQRGSTKLTGTSSNLSYAPEYAVVFRCWDPWKLRVICCLLVSVCT